MKMKRRLKRRRSLIWTQKKEEKKNKKPKKNRERTKKKRIRIKMEIQQKSVSKRKQSSMSRFSLMPKLKRIDDGERITDVDRKLYLCQMEGKSSAMLKVSHHVAVLLAGA